jgi:RNA polymerase primary sigma factor
MSATVLLVSDAADRPVRAADARARQAPVPAEPGVPGSLDIYLREIAAYPLISRDDEAVLGRRIREGDTTAVDALVRANLRFVVSVAKKYQNQGVSLSDLINEGNLGLIRAAHRFDETRGMRFISYAVWWIRQAIHQALADQGRIVRVPRRHAGMLARVNRQVRSLEQSLGREATAAEVAEETALSETEVASAFAMTRPHLSLDAPSTETADDRLLDKIPDDEGARPDEALYSEALADTVAASLGGLREREARVLRLYFGFDGDPLTLEEIGARMGVTRERARQIKERALGRLRRSRAGRTLEQFR